MSEPTQTEVSLIGNASSIANQILQHPNFSASDAAFETLVQAAHSEPSTSGNGSPVFLQPGMLSALLYILDSHALYISAFSNGGHVTQSYHYFGKAIDIAAIDGIAVSPTSDWQSVANLCRDLGGVEVLDPFNEPVGHSDHIHCAFETVAAQKNPEPIPEPPPYGTLQNVNCNFITGHANRAVDVYISMNPDGMHGSVETISVGSDGGFAMPTPLVLHNDLDYYVAAYISGTTTPLDFGLGTRLRCPRAIKRQVASMSVLDAWGGNPGFQTVSDDFVGLYADGPIFAGVPVMVRSEETGAMYVVESFNFNYRHWVRDLHWAQHSWGISDWFNQPESVIAQYPARPGPLPWQPEYVQSTGGILYLLEPAQ